MVRNWNLDNNFFCGQYYRTAVENREVLLALEVDWLKSIRANLVVIAQHPFQIPKILREFECIIIRAWSIL